MHVVRQEPQLTTSRSNFKEAPSTLDYSLRHNYTNMLSDEDIDTRLMHKLSNETSREGPYQT
jgi:hypothetical protein